MRAIGHAWDALAFRSEFVDVYSTSGFAIAWWLAYGQAKELRTIVVAGEDRILRLIAPLYVNTDSPEVLRTLPDYRADYSQIIMAPGDTESLGAMFACLDEHKWWRRIVLAYVPAKATVLRYFPWSYGPEAAWYHKLGAWIHVGSPLVYRQWHEQHPRIEQARLEELRDSVEQTSCRKHVNWFRRQGTLEYRTVTDVVEIRALLPAFFDMHRAQWNWKGEDSLFADQANCRFYEILTEEMKCYDALRMHVLTLDGRMVAAHFGFQWAKRVYYYKPCYDPAFASHSPGKLLLAYIIRQAADEGMDEVDLLYGLEDYKKHYASDVRKTGSLLIQRSRFKALAARFGIGNGS